MRDRRIMAAALLAPLLSAIVGLSRGEPTRGQTSDAKVTKSRFAEARATPERSPSVFEFELSGFAYRIKSNGAGLRSGSGRPRPFNLLLGRESIGRVYFSEYEGNVLLVCAVSEDESESGFVARLEQPSMRAKWKREIAAPNVGVPLRAGRELYVTAEGFVARIDLETGDYAWKHEELSGRGVEGAFNSFAEPALEGDSVLFREAGLYNRPARTIRVNRRTGEILSIE
jgi:hypothetical protein